MRTSADGAGRRSPLPPWRRWRKKPRWSSLLRCFGADLLDWCVHRWRPRAGQPNGACRGVEACADLPQCAAYLLALLPLVGWYAYHFHRTGHVFGNPDYLRYNVGATLTPLRILLRRVMRLWHATRLHESLRAHRRRAAFVWSARRERRSRVTPPAAKRQLRPCASGWQRSDHRQPPTSQLLLAPGGAGAGGGVLRRRRSPAGALHDSRHSAGGAAGGQRAPIAMPRAGSGGSPDAPQRLWQRCCFNPPWFISPEDNLTWTDFVRMHQQAARYVEQHYAGGAHPYRLARSDELNRPFLGYVAKPLTVVRLENFTAEEILRAAAATRKRTSTLWWPSPPNTSRRADSSSTFRAGRHADAATSTSTRICRRRRLRACCMDASSGRTATPGEWIAVIEIDKIRNARMEPRAKFQGFKVSQVSRFARR